ncbi:aminoacyl tRNA synthase complex-interacting multifunctional protein, partial [Thalictrum thalictroides]
IQKRIQPNLLLNCTLVLSMAISSVTLRGATFMLSRSTTLCPLHSAANFSSGKQTGMSVAATPSINIHYLGTVSRRVPLSFPSTNRRFFCMSSEAEAPVADNVTSSVSNTDSTPASPSTPSNDPLKDAAGTLDIRVGRIIKAWRHPEADTLYVEEVDLGEPEPRTICSGLVKYIPLDTLQDLNVVVLANLKPRNMRGVKSNGMLLAASDASHENVELLSPPEGSIIGERIWFGLEEDKENQVSAASPNQIQKKKIWELVQPHLKTDSSCVAALGSHLMRTSAGLVVSKTLQNATIA